MREANAAKDRCDEAERGNGLRKPLTAAGADFERRFDHREAKHQMCDDRTDNAASYLNNDVKQSVARGEIAL